MFGQGIYLAWTMHPINTLRTGKNEDNLNQIIVYYSWINIEYLHASGLARPKPYPLNARKRLKKNKYRLNCHKGVLENATKTTWTTKRFSKLLWKSAILRTTINNLCEFSYQAIVEETCTRGLHTTWVMCRHLRWYGQRTRRGTVSPTLPTLPGCPRRRIPHLVHYT